MNKFVTLNFLCLVASPAILLLAQERKVESKIEISDEFVDQVCEIVLNSDKPAVTQTYFGKVVQFDEEHIVMTDVSRQVRVERSVPILASIPYINRLFRNVCIGFEKVQGKLTIKRSDIHSIKLQK